MATSLWQTGTGTWSSAITTGVQSQTNISSTFKEDIIGINSINFIRPQRIRLSLSDCRPNAKLYPYFDSYRIGDLITGTVPAYNPSDKSSTAYVTTDSDGKWEGFLDIPPNRFNTGSTVVKFQEELDFFSSTILPGVTVSKAQNLFLTNGILATYQITVENLRETANTVTNYSTYTPDWTSGESQADPSGSGSVFGGFFDQFAGLGNLDDPLAQSFFTYGIYGGCFITSIDVYFFQCDPSVPVRLELREMVNGYPSRSLIKDAIVSIPGSQFATPEPASVAAAQVGGRTYYWPSISVDSSKPTTFRFRTPIYLKENSEYCFVLLSESNKYFVFTSQMGQKSFETNKLISEQPFIGSMFKSENNATWSADQTSDIKFTIRQAKFTNTSGTIDYNLYATPVVIPCNYLSTSGTAVTVSLPVKHNMIAGNSFIIKGATGAVWNGIPNSNITSLAASSSVGETPFTVATVIDEYRFTYTATAAATTSGIVTHGGIIIAVTVVAPGSGYSSTPTITITGGTSTGTDNPTLTPVIVDGKIISVTVSNTATPKIWSVLPTLVLSTGSAQLTPVRAGGFILIFPRNFQAIRTAVSDFTPPGTSIVQKVKTTDASTGVTSAYAEMNTNELYFTNNNSKLFVANPTFSDRNTQVALKLTTDNVNVSPVINLRTKPSAMFFDSKINKKEEFTISALSVSGSAGSYIFTFTTATAHNLNIGESVYLGHNPTDITDTGAKNYYGVYTVASITSSTIFTATHNTIGSATYTTLAAVATMSIFDSELLPTGGNASARYLSKIIKLDTISSGVRVYVNAASTTKTWFDVYFRTSLSSGSVKHTDTYWAKLTCDEDRTASNTLADFKDYIFYADNLSKFDVYDVKIVLRSTVKYEYPVIANYRSIILAS